MPASDRDRIRAFIRQSRQPGLAPVALPPETALLTRSDHAARVRACRHKLRIVSPWVATTGVALSLGLLFAPLAMWSTVASLLLGGLSLLHGMFSSFERPFMRQRLDDLTEVSPVFLEQHVEHNELISPRVRSAAEGWLHSGRVLTKRNQRQFQEAIVAEARHRPLQALRLKQQRASNAPARISASDIL